MRRLSDTTIRQRGRLMFWLYMLPIGTCFIFGLAIHHWGIVIAALIAAVFWVGFLLHNEKKTRDDPPHANY